MASKPFATSGEYYDALVAVERSGIGAKHLEMLRAHFSAPRHVVTWRQLAAAVGYPNYETVNLQYGIFARQLAEELGLTKKKLGGFWLHVIAGWAQQPGALGETAFVMHPPMISALKRLGWMVGAPTFSLEDTDVSGLEGDLQLRLVTHRQREGKLRARKIAAARRDSRDGKLRCSVRGCDFCFEEAYGAGASAYIQVHHLSPLASLTGSTQTRLSDLAIVCANCHAMIHYLNPSPALGVLVKVPRR